MPLEYSEDHVRHFYRCFLVSQDTEVFILDSRNGYLGKDQVRWLKENIRKSSAAMKIIFSGQVFGFHLVDQLKDDGSASIEVNPRSSNENSEAENFVSDVTDETKSEENEEMEESTEMVTDIKTHTVDSSDTSAPLKPNTKKVSSSRQKALEATKEEFDDDGLSKSSLGHAVVSAHRRLYPLTEKETDEDDSHEIVTSKSIDSGNNSSKIELSGGIIIVSSTDVEESFVASYNFGRNEDELQTESPFCIEVGLGRACKGSGRPNHFDEKKNLSPADALIARGRKILYRSSYHGDTNKNAISCSIVVNAQGVLQVTLNQVDSGCAVFEALFSSALFN